MQQAVAEGQCALLIWADDPTRDQARGPSVPSAPTGPGFEVLEIAVSHVHVGGEGAPFDADEVEDLREGFLGCANQILIAHENHFPQPSRIRNEDLVGFQPVSDQALEA